MTIHTPEQIRDLSTPEALTLIGCNDSDDYINDIISRLISQELDEITTNDVAEYIRTQGLEELEYRRDHFCSSILEAFQEIRGEELEEVYNCKRSALIYGVIYYTARGDITNLEEVFNLLDTEQIRGDELPDFLHYYKETDEKAEDPATAELIESLKLYFSTGEGYHPDDIHQIARLYRLGHLTHDEALEQCLDYYEEQATTRELLADYYAAIN